MRSQAHDQVMERGSRIESSRALSLQSVCVTQKVRPDLGHVAIVDERVVALVGAYRPSRESVVELVSMWTAPEIRRTGAARRLVGAVLEWAGAGSAEAVELWVTKGNDPAIELYRSVGFRETGDHQALPSDPCKDEVRMRRLLS